MSTTIGAAAWLPIGVRLGQQPSRGQVAPATLTGWTPREIAGQACPLLVRCADPASERDVAALLQDVPLDEREVVDLMRRHQVPVLCDLSLPTAPPLAAAAFRLDRGGRDRAVAGIGVRARLCRKGLGRRLLTGALTWLRADGFERVPAVAAGGGAGASLLASAGFTADQDTDREYGRCRFVLLL